MQKTEIPKVVEEALPLISFLDTPGLVGSFLYQEHYFPGDIDLHEDIYFSHGDLDTILRTIVENLQDKAQQILSVYPDVIFSEVKSCGVKWSIDDLMNEMKTINGNQTTTLNRCLLGSSVIKIDIYLWLPPRYVEASNFMIFYDRTGNLINGEQPDYIKALLADIQMFLKEPNYVKVIKRMWSLEHALQDGRTSYKSSPVVFAKLTEFLSSSTAQAYQVAADITTIMDIGAKYRTDPIINGRLLTMLETFPYRLRDTNILPEFMEAGSLADAKKIVLKYTNHEAKQWLKDNDIENRT